MARAVTKTPAVSPSTPSLLWRGTLAVALAAVLAGCGTATKDAGTPSASSAAAAAPAQAPAAAMPPAPEVSSGYRPGMTTSYGQKHMAAAANPLATEAGREILRAGGSAIDAAVAMQAVLTLVVMPGR